MNTHSISASYVHVPLKSPNLQSDTRFSQAKRKTE